MTTDWAINEYKEIDEMQCSLNGKLLLRIIIVVEDFKIENPNLTFKEIKEEILKRFPATPKT